ncbi:MAG: Holliday junction branch migration protein RuvA [Sphingomonadaceae bacterium]
MIAWVRGRAGRSGADWAIVEVGGVGLKLLCPRSTLQALPPAGEEVLLLTHLIWREDGPLLAGFLGEAELSWFLALEAIQGVGVKVALAVLSALPPPQLAAAIAARDAAAVARAQGVGPKLAVRIVNELKDRAAALGGGDAMPAAAAGPAPAAGDPAAADALQALARLGFRPAEAERAVAEARAALGPEAPLDALLAAALRQAGRGSL